MRLVFRLGISHLGTPMVEVWDVSIVPAVFVCGSYAHKDGLHVVSKYLKDFKELRQKATVADGRIVKELLLIFDEKEIQKDSMKILERRLNK